MDGVSVTFTQRFIAKKTLITRTTISDEETSCKVGNCQEVTKMALKRKIQKYSVCSNDWQIRKA